MSGRLRSMSVHVCLCVPCVVCVCSSVHTGMMKEVLDPYFRACIGDIALCPITINYEHPLEEDIHITSLLGVQKVRESSLVSRRSSSANILN